MIISASRRTDIPAFYGQWFLNRIRVGYAYVRNPFDARALYQVSLRPEDVDAFAFWTKNPEPFFPYLKELEERGYPYYFQFALNACGEGLEPGLPKPERLLESFLKLSDRIGPERNQWRYSPVVFTDEVGADAHRKRFEGLAAALEGRTKVCIVSFLDEYRKLSARLSSSKAFRPDEETILSLLTDFRGIAAAHGIALQSCTELVQIEGVRRLGCINREILETVIGQPIDVSKDRNQRGHCSCVESIDIGEYNSCTHSCVYCYANRDASFVGKNVCRHNPESPLLLGEVTEDMTIHPRKRDSVVVNQQSFFR